MLFFLFSVGALCFFFDEFAIPYYLLCLSRLQLLVPLSQPSVGVGSVEPTTLHVFHSVFLVPYFPVWELGSDSSPPALPRDLPLSTFMARLSKC